VRRDPDGSCLYHALGQTSSFQTAEALRKEIADYIHDHQDELTDINSTYTFSQSLATTFGRDATTVSYRDHMLNIKPWTGAGRNEDGSLKPQWGGMVEIFAFACLRKAHVVVYSKAPNKPTGHFREQWSCGDVTSTITVRLLYNGYHFDNLNVILDGQGLVGRAVLKSFAGYDRPFKGTIVKASPPRPHVPGDEGWVFSVEYEDGDASDYTLDQIQTILTKKHQYP
jgi:hypothetical protein